MKVPTEIIREWKSMKDHGEMKKLMEATGYSHPVLKEAFDGEATEEVIAEINKYFTEKKKRITDSNSKLLETFA